MPKLIDNAKEIILMSAKEELKLHPDTFSMRNVSKNAKVAVGTIYRYYPDKLSLIAEILLNDWKTKYDDVFLSMKTCLNMDDVLRKILKLILDFREKYKDVFDSYKGKEMNMDYPKQHSLFILQIKRLFQQGKKALSLSLNEEIDLMISEMILVQAKSNDISYETLKDIVIKLTIGGLNK